ncbi:MAG TPA: hypothetical protein VIM70_08050 [Clostridium sp.]|uniref:hypothetical protein n=1 Tax=Clostridium sp. TaxID=1506 RepID=UPI002F944904
MVKTIEELVSEMNIRCYTIYIDTLMKNFNKYRNQRELLIDLFKNGYQIEFNEMDNYLQLKKSIGLVGDEYIELQDVVSKLKSRLTIKGLTKCHEETGKELFVIAQLYMTVIKKYEAYENLYKQLGLNPNFENEISIKKRLKFATITSKKDGKKLITLENPTFNALNIEEIKGILGFAEHLECKNDEEMINFINKHERVFRQGFSSNYLIKGNVLYFNIYESEIGL